MKYLLPVLLAASVAVAAPALADPGHGRGEGGWHGGGGSRGEGGRGEGGGWRGNGGGGEPRGGGEGRGGGYGRGGPGGAPEGRWNGGYPGPEAGPIYASPPRGRAASGPEYYPSEQSEARRGVRSGWKSMGEVVGRLQRRGGRMLDAGLTQGPDGRPAYRVIWAAPDGRRIDYIIDAQTGAILEGR